jgi:uncharacterized protein YdeI (YjbR/CyaY-like superfamily)
MNPKVDLYLEEGCGRCSLYQTPQCKVHPWKEELRYLRRIVLECGLTEEVKWGVPCYTFQESNVLLISAFKNYCSISFFKGSLLNDPKGILEKPGKNTQAGRLIKFTNTEKVREIETDIRSCVFEAIEIEKAGQKVNFRKNPEPIPEELLQKFEELPALKAAFEALTPGRQRGYILHFSQPKQSKTRESRIKKCIEKIMNGKGFHDRG